MKLYLKIGTHPAVMVAAPRLRRSPDVGQTFEIREGRGYPLVKVRVCEIATVDRTLYFVERI